MLTKSLKQEEEKNLKEKGVQKPKGCMNNNQKKKKKEGLRENEPGRFMGEPTGFKII